MRSLMAPARLEARDRSSAPDGLIVRRRLLILVALMLAAACRTDQISAEHSALESRPGIDAHEVRDYSLDPMTMVYRGQLVFTDGTPINNGAVELWACPRVLLRDFLVDHRPQTGSVAATSTTTRSGDFSIPIWRDVSVAYQGFLSLHCSVNDRARIVIPAKDWLEQPGPTTVHIEREPLLSARVLDSAGSRIHGARVHLLSSVPNSIRTSLESRKAGRAINMCPSVIAESSTDGDGVCRIYAYTMDSLDRSAHIRYLLIEADGFESTFIPLADAEAHMARSVPHDIRLFPASPESRLRLGAGTESPADEARPFVGWINARRSNLNRYDNEYMSVDAITDEVGRATLPIPPARLDPETGGLDSVGGLLLVAIPFPTYGAPFHVWAGGSGVPIRDDEWSFEHSPTDDTFRLSTSLRNLRVRVIDDASGEAIERPWIRRTTRYKQITDTKTRGSRWLVDLAEGDFEGRYYEPNGFGFMWPPPKCLVNEGSISVTMLPSYAMRIDAFGYIPQVVQVPTNASLTPIEVRLKRGATLLGRVVTADGAPVAGATLLLQPTGRVDGYDRFHHPARNFDFKMAWTDSDGRFSMAQVPQGSNYTVTATAKHLPIRPRPSTWGSNPNPSIIGTYYGIPKDGVVLRGKVVVSEADESGNVIQLGDFELPR